MLLAAIVAAPLLATAFHARQQEGPTLSAVQFEQMSSAVATARRFVSVAERGDLRAARALYSGQHFQFGTVKALRGSFAGYRYRFESVHWQPANGGSGAWIDVNFRPARGYQNGGDKSFSIRPATGRIFSVYEAND